jgi:hypothetical protein
MGSKWHIFCNDWPREEKDLNKVKYVTNPPASGLKERVWKNGDVKTLEKVKNQDQVQKKEYKLKPN